LKSWFGRILGLLIILLIILMIVAAIKPSLVSNIIPTQFEFLHILPTKVDLTQGEQRLFTLINQERENNGLHPLIWDENLASYSRKHSADMASSGILYHNTAELSVLHAGENALMMPKSYGGFGVLPYFYFRFYRDSNTLWKDSVKSWMDSTGHRANILTSTYTYTGIGIAIASDGITFYVTQDFK
jgi:uncharacterized protein YkwD